VACSIVLLVDADVPETAMRSMLYQNEGFIVLTAFRCDEALIMFEQLPIRIGSSLNRNAWMEWARVSSQTSSS
jgi:hypothetical protein